jgi:hypothetical protein
MNIDPAFLFFMTGLRGDGSRTTLYPPGKARGAASEARRVTPSGKFAGAGRDHVAGVERAASHGHSPTECAVMTTVTTAWSECRCAADWRSLAEQLTHTSELARDRETRFDFRFLARIALERAAPKTKPPRAKPPRGTRPRKK